jgi:hypothetical protein
VALYLNVTTNHAKIAKGSQTAQIFLLCEYHNHISFNTFNADVQLLGKVFYSPVETFGVLALVVPFE